MRRLSLLQMDTLCCIARVKTFTAAAEKLHTTQSAISARVREMEVSLGVKLFERRGRQAELTALAREFVKKAEPLLIQLNGIAATLEDTAGAPVHVRLGTGPSTLSWLPAVLRKVQDQMPHVAYDVETGTSIELVHGIESGRFDLAVLAASHLDTSRLQVTPLGWETMRWFISTDLQDLDRLTSEELLQRYPAIMMPRTSFYFVRVMNALREHGLTPSKISTCDSTAVLLNLVEGGLGTGVIPEGIARAAAQEGRIRQVLHEVVVEPIEYLVVRQRGDDRPHLDLLLEHAIAAGRRFVRPTRP